MIKSRLSAFRTDKKGSVLVYVALAMPVLVGGMGLGAETGYRYYNQRLLQHAADFAAHAGAVHKYKDENKAQIDLAALNVAESSEYDHTLGTITVNIPPASGAFTGEPSAVEVILTETRPRLFSAIFSNTPVVIGARAVAAANGNVQPACILALSTTASPALTVTGSTNIKLTDCAVASNSTADDSFKMSGLGSYLETDCVSSSGGAETTSNLTLVDCPSAKTDQDAVNDPYNWLPEPTAEANIKCQTEYPGKNTQIGKPNKTTIVDPIAADKTASWMSRPVMRFCGGLDLKGDVEFEPGFYIIEDGNFTVSGTKTPKISGVDVTFYFTNGGAAKIAANAQLNFAAPTTGTHKGILFFGGEYDPDAHIIQGNASSTLTGAIYMPASEVTFSGNSDGGSGCTQVIANTIILTGNSDLAIDCSDAGTQEINIGQLISVVE
jgi:Flp pilus assembly protein TadG